MYGRKVGKEECWPDHADSLSRKTLKRNVDRECRSERSECKYIQKESKKAKTQNRGTRRFNNPP